MNILITGSSGTIGTRLSEILIRYGYNVFCCDKRLNFWNKEVNDRTIKINLRSKSAIKLKLPKKIDLIIHLAANARVNNLVINPNLAKENIDIIFNVLEYGRKNNIINFIFASSREVYGNTNVIKHKEIDHYVHNCESPYTASKIAGEALVHSYNLCYNMNYLIFRFSNVYGRYDNSDRVIPNFIKLCKNNEDLTIYGKEKLLDFTYVDDVINGIISGIETFKINLNNTFNIAMGTGNSITKVAELIREGTNSKSNLLFKDNRTGEVVKYIADIAKAKKLLKYSPKFSIEKGIKKTIEWYSENKIY